MGLFVLLLTDPMEVHLLLGAQLATCSHLKE